MTEGTEFLSCRDLLRLPSMSGSILLSGDEKLDGKIARANVIEAPDMANWANAGEVVISSGYPFRNSEADLTGALCELSEKGIAAFCLKPRRFYNNIPQAVVQKARELDLVLVELPIEAVFANIVHEITEEILQKETLSFRNIQDKIELLLDTLFKGDGMDDWLPGIEKAIGNPLLIFNSDNELLMSQGTRELLGSQIQEDFIRQLYKNENRGHLSILLNGSEVGLLSFQVEIVNQEYMRMILLQYHSTASDSDVVAIKRISRILALEMRNAMAIKKNRRRYKDKFVQDWLFNNFANEFDISMFAHTYGYELDLRQKYQVAIININTRQNSGLFAEEDVSIIHHLIKSLDPNIIFTIHSGKLILILESDGEEGEDTASLKNLTHLVDRLKYILDKGEMSLCISRPFYAKDVPMAYLQAKKISDISRKCNINTPLITQEQLGVLSLLAQLPEDESVRHYKDKFLSPLKQYDATHRSNLLNTLQVYLGEKCNTKVTAEKLFTHYNTVTYRLERIKKILNADIEDAEVQLQLQIAFKLDLIQP